jgi:ectoine hydroxylase-related dioxygenase (phytanoyl-CoA dioxygenase family)
MRYEKQPGNASLGYYRKLQFNQRKNQAPLKALTEAQWTFWQKNGYVVVPGMISEEKVNRLVKAIWAFEEKDPQNPKTWYHPPRKEIEMKELVGSGMVEMYHHQCMWDIRQDPRVYEVFVDIWGTRKLWVSIDRVNLNLPVRKNEFQGFIHWDIDTSDPNRNNNIQATISLSDTTEQTGGFQCVPELYREFDPWVKNQPPDRDPFLPDITGFEIEQVETRAGDLLIWDSMLAHGIRPNRSNQPRIAQYVAMTPAQEDNKKLRKWRIRSWEERIPPEGYAFPGDPRRWEQIHQPKAILTELGKKLLGLQSWEEL